jgi:O-antigen/teichoic acid export membrane protein
MNINYLKSISFNAITSILIIPASIIQLKILTNYLDTESFGFYSIFFTFYNLISPFIGLGIGTSFSRDYPTFKSKSKLSESYFTVFYFKIIQSLFLSIIFLFLFKFEIYNIFESFNFTLLACAYLIILPIFPLQARILRSSKKIKILSLANLIEAYLNLFLTFFSLYNFKSLTILLSFILFSNFLKTLILQIIINKSLDHNTFISKSLIHKYLSFGVSTLPSSLSNFFVEFSDRFLITFYLGNSALSYYHVSNSLMIIPKTIRGFASFLLFEEYRKIELNDKTRAYALINLTSFLYLIINSLIFIILIFYGKSIISLISNSHYAEISHKPMLILYISYIIFGLYSYYNTILLANGDKKKLISTWMIALPVNLILNIVFLKEYGIIIAAISTFISYSIILIYVLLNVDKNLLLIKLHYYKKILKKNA